MLKTKQLTKSKTYFKSQRRQISLKEREALLNSKSSIAGRWGEGVYLQTNKSNGLLLFSNVIIREPILYTGKEYLKGEFRIFRLSHLWINKDLLFNVDKPDLKVGSCYSFKGQITEYSRADGSTSIGLAKLNEGAELLLYLALFLVTVFSKEPNPRMVYSCSYYLLNQIQELNPKLAKLYLKDELLMLLNKVQAIAERTLIKQLQARLKKIHKKLQIAESFRGFGPRPYLSKQELDLLDKVSEYHALERAA